jgi:hypothetical protein
MNADQFTKPVAVTIILGCWRLRRQGKSLGRILRGARILEWPQYPATAIVC